jgi:hypothetical protein
MRAHRAAVAALLATLVPYVVLLVGIPASGDQDAAIHAIYSRWPLEPNPAPFPYRVLTVWSRPIFALAYALPGQLGFTAMRLFTLALCAVTGWLTYLLARRLALPHPWLAVPLVLLQPVMLQVGVDVMTEPLFALLLAAGMLAMESGRRLLAACLLSLLPLARPEGGLVLAVLGVVWGLESLRDRRALVPLLGLGLGLVLWEAVVLAVTGNWRYLLDTFPWPVRSDRWQGSPFHYLLRWPLILGAAGLVPWLVGLKPSWRAGGSPRLGVLFISAVLGVHAFLFATGGFASTGFERYFATLSPTNGLIALAGVAWLVKRGLHWLRLVLPPALALQAVHGLIWIDAQPLAHLPQATLQTLHEARSRVDFTDRFVIASDLHAFVFLDIDPGPRDARLRASRELAVKRIEQLPAGTVVLWDNMVGQWWYGLAVEDFTARGYQVLWEQEAELRSPLLNRPSGRRLRQAVLVRNPGPASQG